MPRTRIKMRKMRRPRTSPTRFCAGRICFCSKGIKKGISYSVGITQTTHTRPKKTQNIVAQQKHGTTRAPRRTSSGLLLLLRGVPRVRRRRRSKEARRSSSSWWWWWYSFFFFVVWVCVCVFCFGVVKL